MLAKTVGGGADIFAPKIKNWIQMLRHTICTCDLSSVGISGTWFKKNNNKKKNKSFCACVFPFSWAFGVLLIYFQKDHQPQQVMFSKEVS